MHAKFQLNILTTALVIAKFKYLTFDTYLGSKRCGKILTLSCISTGTGQSWSIVNYIVEYSSLEEMSQSLHKKLIYEKWGCSGLQIFFQKLTFLTYTGSALFKN